MNVPERRDDAARSRTLAVRLAIGLAQGLALAALWRVSQARPPWAVDGLLYPASLMIALYVPLIPLLGLGIVRPFVLAGWTLVAAALLGFATAHDIWRALPDYNRFVVATPRFELALYAAAALFILHHLIEAADVARRWRPPYAAYVEATWRHAFQLPLSFAFAGALWGILALGEAMFSAIKLKAVADILGSAWLVQPLVGLALAFAIERTDAQPSLIQGVRRIGLMLLAWLLPVATLLVAVFLLALFVTGLAPLWATRSSTGLLLSAAAALIVFLNAAYQDGGEAAALPPMLRWGGRLAGLLLVPVVALAAWGLGLRIGQYGLSPERVVASLLCGIAALYALGYAWAALSRGAWMRPLEIVNLVAAIVAVVAILLVFSPVADPARLAVDSQVARLQSGQVAPEHFDFDALRFSMMRYGRAALIRLAGSTDPEIARLATSAKQKSYDGERMPLAGAAFANAVVRPAGATLPPGFREQEWSMAEPRYQVAACLYSADPCDLIVVDLDGDGRPEVVARTSGGELWAYARDPSSIWRRVGSYVWTSDAPARAAIAAGRVEPIPPRFDDLRIGDRRASFMPYHGLPWIDFIGHVEPRGRLDPTPR